METEDFKPILTILGLVLACFAPLMAIPGVTAAGLGETTEAWAFLMSAGLALFSGVSLHLATRPAPDRLNMRQTCALLIAIWAALTLTAAAPLTASSVGLSFTDACFEAMSGLTTTGATVMTGLDETSTAVLLWRGMLQWIGGIGIVVIAVGVLPILRIGGMQLFRLEFSDRDGDGKAPPIATLSVWLAAIYLSLSVICMLVYWLAGMTAFDALIHAMTTIATGGFSSHDASFGHFDAPALQGAAIVFMLAASLPFLMYLKLLHLRLSALTSDPQAMRFLLFAAFAAAAATAAARFGGMAEDDVSTLTIGFNTVSVLTGTGYASAPYDRWSEGLSVLFLCLMLVGGCAGSTSCGIKVFRFQILWRAAKVTIDQGVHPNRVHSIRYGSRAIDDATLLSVVNFVIVFFLIFAGLATALALTGLDGLTSMSAALAALANVGPGLGPIVGPSDAYAGVPETGKWLLIAGMLMGRLEFFTVLALLSPGFWRR